MYKCISPYHLKYCNIYKITQEKVELETYMN